MSKEAQHGNRDIVKRIEREQGAPDLLSTLTQMPRTDLQTLLLELFAAYGERTTIQDVNQALDKGPLVAPSAVDQRTFNAFESIAWQVLPNRYKGVDLAPVAPFGLNGVLGHIDQKRVFSTTRTVELLADPTTILAAHAARERRQITRKNAKNAEQVTLATSQRVIRQEIPKDKHYSPHFRTFSLAVAGRDVGFEAFERENLLEHITTFLSLFSALNGSGEYTINDVTIWLAPVGTNSSPIFAILREALESELQVSFPDVAIKIDESRTSQYYKNLCYRITGTPVDGGDALSIAGGGFVDWSQKIVASRKERCLVGAVGSETICKHFAKMEEHK